MKEERNATTAARPAGAARAGTVIAIDWGCPFAPKKPKPHVAVIRASDTRVIKFKAVQELVEKVPAPAVVFAEAAGPYLELCQLYDAYHNVFSVDTKLTAEYRRKNGVPKSDENDARVILAIAEDYLDGKLREGVWKFEPDELRRTLLEAKRKLKLYRKTFRLDYRLAKKYKREYKALIRRAVELAKKLPEYQRAVRALGLSGASLALIVAKLRYFRSGKVRAWLAHAGFDATRAKHLCKMCKELREQGVRREDLPHKHGKYDRMLHGAARSLAEMAIVKKIEPWYSVYKEYKNALKEHNKPHPDKGARVRLAAKMLAEVFKAVRQ